MKQLFKDTLECEAMHYLDESGDEMSGKEGFLEYCLTEMHNGLHAYMLYVGGGFVKLAFAVMAWDEDDARATMEEWCMRNGREDEINGFPDSPEDEYLNYELIVEEIPAPMVITRAEYDELKGKK